jgi:uncharacterized protein DUF3631
LTTSAVSFNNLGVRRVTTADLLASLAQLDDPANEGDHRDLTPRALAARLRAFDIEPKVMRFGEVTARGYERAASEDAWSRYVPAPEA